MSNDPLRRLANAIFDPSGDQAGSTWKKSPFRIRRITGLVGEATLVATARVHGEDRVVTVPRADEREILPCLA